MSPTGRTETFMPCGVQSKGGADALKGIDPVRVIAQRHEVHLIQLIH
jgi:hypothetical protein